MADDDKAMYFVVVNHEEQYSIWRSDRDLPAGWQSVGPAREKQACLDDIDERWIDMRPLSLRQAMSGQ